jgi:hypothetical protein
MIILCCASKGLVIVDDDRMEGRNVNRILNSTMRDLRDRRLKVDVLSDALASKET